MALKCGYWLGLPIAILWWGEVCCAVICEESLARISNVVSVAAAPAAPPVAPPKPAPRPNHPAPAPSPNPAPNPAPNPRPFPRRQVPVPAPAPNEPVRRVPAQPVHDPKDVQPSDLYNFEGGIRGFWNTMPIGLRRLMVEALRQERQELETHINNRYGGSSPAILLREVQRLSAEIRAIESSHRPALVALIQRMIENRYGAISNDLQVSITPNLQRRAPHNPQTNGTLPELPSNVFDGLVYRTELRNLWQQGEGWLGAREFAFLYANELNAIHPGLAERYQELDRFYRLGQLAILGQIPSHDQVPALNQIPRDSISHGQIDVDIMPQLVAMADGSEVIEINQVTGRAVGNNGWAAALEARKAAAQMRTPNEAALRWLLSPGQRTQLNDTTNSVVAEVRQGIFGPVFVRELQRRIGTVFRQNAEPVLSDREHYDMMDGVFSLHPGAFQHVVSRLFQSDFDTNVSLRAEIRNFLEGNGINRASADE